MVPNSFEETVPDTGQLNTCLIPDSVIPRERLHLPINPVWKVHPEEAAVVGLTFH
jgi:hypothetical protein